MRLLRRWWWVALLVLVIALRGALPEIVRSQIETRASDALGAPVAVGNVDLGLLSGFVALDDVTVRAKDAPPEEESLIAWKRFAVDLRWLMLLRKTIRFATIELVAPQVAPDRLQSGDINLAALVPRSEAIDEEPAEPSTWKFGIDYLGLHRGGVRFRDFVVAGAEPLALALESIEIRDIAMTPDVYGGPGGLKFVARMEGGAVRTRARLVPGPEGVGIDVTLHASKLPLHRSRVYVPGVAWSDLRGLASFGLRYRLEPGGRNELSGRVGLDELTVFTAGLDEPALAWKRLAVNLDRIDLAGHDARIGDVTLDGVVLPVRPKGPVVLPVLAAARAARAAAAGSPPAGGSPDPSAPPAPPDGAPASADATTTTTTAVPSVAPSSAPATKADEPPAAPWTWSVAGVALTDGRVRVLADRGLLEIGTVATVKNVADPERDASPIEVGLTVGDSAFALKGDLRRSPVGFAGKVTSTAFDVPKLLDALEVLPPHVLQVAKFDSDMDVALGGAAPTPGDLKVSGTATLSDLWIAGTDPKEFAAGAKRIVTPLTDLVVPGVLAPSPPRDRATSVALGPITVDGLYARVTRAPEGVILPRLGPGGASPAAEPAPDAAPPPRASGAGPPPPTITAERVTVTKARVDLTDRTVKPFYWSALDPIDVDLQRVRFPDVSIDAVRAHVVTNKKGTIDVTGGFTAKSKLELVVKNLSLMPFNPYVTSLSPYSVSRGALFVTVKATKDGSSYDTTTWVTLADFNLATKGGKHVVLDQLGIPITVAMALLRDWRGNIDLTIPVQITEKGTEVGLGSIIGQALVKALVGTLMSPLKLVGAILPTGGSGAESLAPQPIRFHAGIGLLDDAGKEQVGQLAGFLAGRPGLGVTLDARPTPADVRGLREQALAAQLGPRSGFVGTIRSVGARGRIVDALAARAKGEEGALDPEDQQALDDYLEEIPAPTPAQLAALGTARLKVVETELRESFGIADAQISRAPLEGEAEGDPAVRIELGAM